LTRYNCFRSGFFFSDADFSIQKLAEENIVLFLHCFNKGHDALQVTALQVLCDILTTHPSLLSLQANAALQKSVYRVFSKGLKASHSTEVQGAATIALCKLMLTGVIQDEDLLKQIIICYFDPTTRENAVVRQALSYFLPVYTNSRRENMERLATVVPSVLHAVLGLVEELDEEEEMVGMGVVGNMLVDWTDARKLVVQDEVHTGWDEAGRRESKPINGDIHLDLAANLLKRGMGHICTSQFMHQFIWFRY
jgi:condensin complex subunit 3